MTQDETNFPRRAIIDFEDLFSVIRALPEVPDRARARERKRSSEDWIVGRLLAALGYAGELKFPCCILGREHPDYQVKMPSCVIGIEATQATDQQLNHKLGVAAKIGDWRHPVGTFPLSKLDDWLQLVTKRLVEKFTQASRAHFQHFDTSTLVVYDNTFRFVDTSVAIERLMLELPTGCPFDRVYLITGACAVLIPCNERKRDPPTYFKIPTELLS